MDKQRISEIKRLYNEAPNVWPENDLWHYYTRHHIYERVIHYLASETDKASYILNAGSGRTVYPLQGTFVDCDIAENTLIGSQHAIVASVDDLPFDKDSFSHIICVGSVLNYCDVFSAIGEFSRTIRFNGLLVIEFERSSSGEFLFENDYGHSIIKRSYNYNGQSHQLWLYSENYIQDILKCYNFKLQHLERFHCISSLLSRVFEDEKIAKYAKLDKYVPRILSSAFAHNAVMVCRKC